MTDTSPDPPLWTFTVHHRDFATPTAAHRTGLGELTGARSRRLQLGWNGPATLTWTTDGRAPASGLALELATDVMAWRDGVLMFRGPVTNTEDTLSEQAHSVNWTAHDYLAVLNRRYITAATGVTIPPAGVIDQDGIVAELVRLAAPGATSSAGSAFTPGSLIPLTVAPTNPDGTDRGPSGVQRTRTYTGGKSIGEAITDLAAVIQGFDVSIEPQADGFDRLRIWYSQRGEPRADVALIYGVTVAGLTRTVNSADYANYVRIVGKSEDTAEGAPQTIAEAWNPDAGSAGGTLPVGLWATTGQASDVSDPVTLQQKADGLLQQMGVLEPSYTLTLRPGWYRPGYPNLGDTVPLVVRSPPRLDVSTTVRVVGLTYVIGDDGQEDVELTVGAPTVPLTAVFAQMRADIGALARR